MSLNSIFKSILIVDDNKIDTILAKKTLEKDGYCENVVPFNSAKEAIKYLSELASKEFEYIPSIVFVDMMMPDMNGFQFLEKFNELPDSIKKITKIVFVSGSLPSEDQQSQLNSNSSVLKFISKPLDKSSLELVAKLYAELN